MNLTRPNAPEPAEALLALTPARTYTLAEDGFVAVRYDPDLDEFPGKALIVVGGSDGLFSLIRLAAECFAAHGLTTLALAYWNRPGLPGELGRIPIEPVRDAARALRSEGFGHVDVWGISKGAELALVAASHFTDDLSRVVAASPIRLLPGHRRRPRPAAPARVLNLDA